jgi:hypothetical protein
MRRDARSRIRGESCGVVVVATCLGERGRSPARSRGGDAHRANALERSASEVRSRR